MKRLTATIVAILYLSFSSGITINLHYCMGEYVNFSFFDAGKGACDKCGMEKHEDSNACCKDVKETAKISDVHKTPVNNISVLVNNPPNISTICNLSNIPSSIAAYTIPLIQNICSPPGRIPPYYIEFRNLRI